jgi:hypothetical protein
LGLMNNHLKCTDAYGTYGIPKLSSFMCHRVRQYPTSLYFKQSTYKIWRNLDIRKVTILDFKVSVFKSLEKYRKTTGLTCQRPTMAQGCVSRPAHAHTRTATPRWLSHRPPPCTSAIDHPPPPLHAQPMQPLPPRVCRALIPHSGHVETPYPTSSSAATKLPPDSAVPLTALLCSKHRTLTTEHRPCAPRSHAKLATTLSRRPL